MIRMRNRWFRLLPLFLAALWLPFQAIAATAMPFCRHGEVHDTAAMVAMVDEAAEHCHLSGQQQPTQSGHGMDCDNCEFCHLAAGFMPATEYAAAVMASDRDFQADLPLAPASAIPEPPQQPPKRLI